MSPHFFSRYIRAQFRAAWPECGFTTEARRHGGAFGKMRRIWEDEKMELISFSETKSKSGCLRESTEQLELPSAPPCLRGGNEFVSARIAAGYLALFVSLAAAVSFAAKPGGGAADDDDLRPSTGSVPVSRPMSTDYRVLLSRSVFSRDHNRARVVTKEAPATQAAPYPDLTAGGALEAEANFVLKGIAIEDGLPIAFFEQTANQQTVRVRAGQTVSHGQISAITLDGINYHTGATFSHVTIGQALDGGLATSGSTTQPSGDAAKPVAEHPAGEKPSWWRRSK